MSITLLAPITSDNRRLTFESVDGSCYEGELISTTGANVFHLVNQTNTNTQTPTPTPNTPTPTPNTQTPTPTPNTVLHNNPQTIVVMDYPNHLYFSLMVQRRTAIKYQQQVQLQVNYATTHLQVTHYQQVIFVRLKFQTLAKEV